jgi:translation initiation factor 1
MRDNARTVYSTGAGRVCPGCGWPADNCQCSSQHHKDDPLPPRIVAKLRVEKTGRGGKTVTVIYDLPRNTAFLKELTQELKRTCGTGGTAGEDRVELQGELRDRVREYLRNKGYVVKG